MGIKSVCTKFAAWLQTTELFARPSKQLPGKWYLFEYFYENNNDLLHLEENQLKTENIFFNLEFSENNEFILNSNLEVPLIGGLQNGTWSRTKNYITIIHPNDFRNNVLFQFAINKGILKLLNKNHRGKIEFFGFFRQIN